MRRGMAPPGGCAESGLAKAASGCVALAAWWSWGGAQLNRIRTVLALTTISGRPPYVELSEVGWIPTEPSPESGAGAGSGSFRSIAARFPPRLPGGSCWEGSVTGWDAEGVVERAAGDGRRVGEGNAGGRPRQGRARGNSGPQTSQPTDGRRFPTEGVPDERPPRFRPLDDGLAGVSKVGGLLLAKSGCVVITRCYRGVGREMAIPA